MKKSGSVINILALCTLIVNFLGDVLLHILQKEKIGPKITAKIDRVAAALIPGKRDHIRVARLLHFWSQTLKQCSLFFFVFAFCFLCLLTKLMTIWLQKCSDLATLDHIISPLDPVYTVPDIWSRYQFE